MRMSTMRAALPSLCLAIISALPISGPAAAAELKERIVSRCREELGEVHGMAEMYVGTIHAFCLDLLTVMSYCVLILGTRPQHAARVSCTVL